MGLAKHSKVSTGIQRYTGFTLAEVLITLGIIGIVAVMTIPTVIENTQDAQFKAAWKKEYSTINQVVSRIYADENVTYNCVRGADMSCLATELPAYFCKMQKRMSIVKSGINCPVDENSGSPTNNGKYYWHADNTWYQKDGTALNFVGNTGYNPFSAQLSDGAIINFRCGDIILVDVNGYKSPNTAGKDIFVAVLTKNTKVITPGQIDGGGYDYPGCANVGTWVNSTNYEQDCESGSGWGCSSVDLFK